MFLIIIEMNYYIESKSLMQKGGHTHGMHSQLPPRANLRVATRFHYAVSKRTPLTISITANDNKNLKINEKIAFVNNNLIFNVTC